MSKNGVSDKDVANAFNGELLQDWVISGGDGVELAVVKALELDCKNMEVYKTEKERLSSENKHTRLEISPETASAATASAASTT
jgi:hypothetical protein